MTYRITVNLPDDVGERIVELSNDLDRSSSWVLEQAARLYLDGRPAFTPIVDATGGSYCLTLFFSLPNLGADERTDEMACGIRDRALAWLRQQGAGEAWESGLHGVRPMTDARTPSRGGHVPYWARDPLAPEEQLAEANALERARAARAAADADPSRRIPWAEAKAQIDAGRAARGEIIDDEPVAVDDALSMLAADEDLAAGRTIPLDQL